MLNPHRPGLLFVSLLCAATAVPAMAATAAADGQKLLNGQRKKKRLEPKTLPRYQGPPGGIGV